MLAHPPANAEISYSMSPAPLSVRISAAAVGGYIEISKIRKNLLCCKWLEPSGNLKEK